MQDDLVLGVDIGGSGIKGAVVDIKTGQLVDDRFRLETPHPATPDAIAKIFKSLVKHFKWKDKIGCGFPAIVKEGTAYSAANIHKSWLGTNIEKLFSETCGCEVLVLNDADAAGMAEMDFGVGNGCEGTVILITIGTGLGSSMFRNGILLPNTEFGHVYLKGHKTIAEKYASNSVRKDKDLSWDEWGKRFNKYLQHLEHLLSPDVFILGGGGSKKFEFFAEFLKVDAEIIPARLLNNAGIIGAASYANKMVFE